MQLIGMKDDCWTMEFAKSKSKQHGEEQHQKHVYANPMHPEICPILNNALHWSVTAHRSKSHKMYEGPKQNDRFNTALNKLIKQYEDELLTLGAASHGFKYTSHGLRKGSATYVAGGSTCAPPPTSIMIRADWALGQVLSCYLKFADGGDQFVGRTVCGLPPDSTEFGILLPHFAEADAVDFNDAAELQFPDLWQAYPHLRGNLASAIASLVYHHDWLREHLGKNMDKPHPFFSTSMFRNKERLLRLRQKVTLDSGEVAASGIPPHVNIMKQLRHQESNLQEMAGELRNVVQAVQKFSEEAIDTISNGLIERAEQDCADRGVVTMTALKSVLQERDTHIMAQFTSLLEKIPHVPSPLAPDNLSVPDDSPPEITYRLFQHDPDRRHNPTPRLYPVMENFQVPDSAKTPLSTALHLWYGGDPSTGVLPFRKLDKNSLGISVVQLRKVGVDRKRTYPEYHARIERTAAVLSDWRRVMQPFDEAVMPLLSETPSAPELNTAYELAMTILREEYVGFAFQRPRHSQLSISTWAKFLKPSFIMTKGTGTDKISLAKRRRSNSKYTKGAELAVTEALERGETPPKAAAV